MKVQITTDSAADLSPELIERYGVKVAPLYIVIGENSYKDGIEIDTFKLFDELTRPDSKATTSAVSEHDYLALFGPIVAEGQAVVHINISGRLSVSHENAVSAAKNFQNVYVVDSKSVTAGSAILVIKACELAAQGKTAEEIRDAIQSLADQVHTTCILDTLTYVRRGGRISSVAAFGAELLHLKPMVEVNEGLLTVGKKYRGKLEKVLQKYVTELLTDRNDIDLSRVIIANSLYDKSILEPVKEWIASLQKFEEVIVLNAGCVISCHAGPNAVGVIYMRK